MVEQEVQLAVLRKAAHSGTEWITSKRYRVITPHTTDTETRTGRPLPTCPPPQHHHHHTPLLTPPSPLLLLTHPCHHQPSYSCHHQPSYSCHHQPSHRCHHQPSYSCHPPFCSCSSPPHSPCCCSCTSPMPGIRAGREGSVPPARPMMPSPIMDRGCPAPSAPGPAPGPFPAALSSPCPCPPGRSSSPCSRSAQMSPGRARHQKRAVLSWLPARNASEGGGGG